MIPAALALSACASPPATPASPCGPREKCGHPEPPETAEQQWAAVESTLRAGIARVRAACGTDVKGAYDKETWNGVPLPDSPGVLMVRAVELQVQQATKELADVCRVGTDADKATVRSVREIVVRYQPKGAPAELTRDGKLALNFDPTGPYDPYYLRRQYGWTWRAE